MDKKEYYEFEEENISYDNIVLKYKEGILYDLSNELICNDIHPHKNIIEKRKYINNEYIVVENLDISYLNIQSPFNGNKWSGFNKSDRLIQYHKIQNNNIIIEIQNIEHYRILEIDNSGILKS